LLKLPFSLLTNMDKDIIPEYMIFIFYFLDPYGSNDIMTC
jgi:hypothetical protein